MIRHSTERLLLTGVLTGVAAVGALAVLTSTAMAVDVKTIVTPNGTMCPSDGLIRGYGYFVAEDADGHALQEEIGVLDECPDDLRGVYLLAKDLDTGQTESIRIQHDSADGDHRRERDVYFPEGDDMDLKACYLNSNGNIIQESCDHSFTAS